MNPFKKIFGSKNDRELRRLWPLVRRVNELEEEISQLPDEGLRARAEGLRQRVLEATAAERERLEALTAELRDSGPEDDKERLLETIEDQRKHVLKVEKGALDEVLPEAFALVREASKRTTGMRHFDVQLLGGIVLHEGKIAEMKTGEGKTLVATAPLFLNALSGRGAHLVTVNDYLARRDVQWMGPIFHLLGQSVASIVHEESFVYDPAATNKDYRLLGLREVERQDAYRADITYGTNHEFGFDYLRDNMKFGLEEYAQRELNFAIVDEVDNILIDEARTPLIISGPAEESTDKYYKIDRIIPRLKRGAVVQGDIKEDQRAAVEAQGDYTVDEKSRTAVLTEHGVSKVERLLGLSNLYDPRNIDILHHANQALKAHAVFRRDVDYVVKEGTVVIVDEFTGRLMPGRRWSDGLHQAVEAKEGVRIERENQTLATITIQNYFRMYNKLAGMTGTADTESVEFNKIYKLQVILIPPNQTMVRADHPDVVYKTQREKFDAVIEDVAECHERGQPVLVGTVSVEKSETLSKLLKKKGVRHNVLNAVNHEAEASVIAQAGRFAQVTIATNMAGRGTDILLGGNPEFLARTEMENEWIRRADVLPDHGRYEDALTAVRERFDQKAEQLRQEFEPLWKPLEIQQNEALHLLTRAERDLLEARLHHTAAAVSEALNRVRDDLDGAAARASGLTAVGDYTAALQAFDHASGPHFGEEGEQRFARATKDLGALLETTPTSAAFASARTTFERVRADYERAVAKAYSNGGMSLAEAQESYEKCENDYREAEEGFVERRKPYEEAFAAAQREYEETRKKYARAVEDVREQLEQAPQEFQDKHVLLIEKYKETCADEREKVVAAGGLHIIGTERHESRRIDNQLRGRAGRQGDPGSSRFYLSLEDDILRIFGADRIKGLMERMGMEEGEPIEHRLITRAIANAQSKVEAHNFDIRKHLLEYDDVMNKQREVIYALRRDILSRDDLKGDVLVRIEDIGAGLVGQYAGADMGPDEWDWTALQESVLKQFNVRLALGDEERAEISSAALEETLIDHVKAAYEAKEEKFTPPVLRHLEKVILLQTVDGLWKDHLLNMDHLKEGIGLRGYGQRNPLQEYQKEGFALFEGMLQKIDEDVVEKLCTVQIADPSELERVREMEVAGQRRPQQMVMSGGGAPAQPRQQRQTFRRDVDKVGRNDPCPCGSGKKYKKCHGTA